MNASKAMIAKPDNSDYFRLLLLAGIGLFAVILYRNLLMAQYVMDEFQQAVMAAWFKWGLWPYRDYAVEKNLLGTSLYTPACLLSDSTSVIVLICRHMALVYAVVTLIFLFLLHRRVFDGRYGPLLAIFWAMACSNFLERSFRVRVDMLMTMFAVAGVYAHVALRSWKGALAAGVLFSLAFCTTQKAAYFIVAFTVSFAITARKSTEHPLRDFAAYAAGGLATFLAYALFFGQGGYFMQVVRQTFFASATLGVALQDQYGGMFVFYQMTFLRNILFYCLAFAGLVYSAWRYRANPWERNFLACFTFIMAFFLAIHRSPWPYVFVAVIPFLGSYAGYLSERFWTSVRDARVKWAAAVSVFLIVAAGAMVRHVQHLRVTNDLQYYTANAAEAILDPNDTYFDGILMLSTRRHATNYILVRVELMRLLRNWDRERPALIDGLRKAQCKLLIWNYRLEALPNDFIESFFFRHYILIDANLFVSGAHVGKPSEEIDLIWGGEYVTMPNGPITNIRVDGRTIEPLQPIALSAGTHRVESTGTGTLQLLPVEAYNWMRQRWPTPRLDVPLYGEGRYDAYVI